MPSIRIFVKYLIVLFLLQLVIDLIQYFEIIERFSIFRELNLLYIPIIILLLNDFRRSNSSFKTTVWTIVALPFIVSWIGGLLGLTFREMCGESYTSSHNFMMAKCSFNVTFNPIRIMSFELMGFELYQRNLFLLSSYNLFLSPFFLFPLTYFIYVLFHFFKQKQINPFWSFVPFFHKIKLLKISDLPWTWIFIFMIPIVGLFWMYKMNKIIVQKEGIPESYAIWMTIAPHFFYGRLLFKGKEVKDETVEA